MYNLEDETCNCIRDWRHEFLKALLILNIFIACIMPLIVKFENTKFYKIFGIIYYIIMGVNTYAFYTYIGDINSTKCSCAVDKQPIINFILYYYRYALLAFSGLVVCGLVFNGLIFIKNKFHKNS